MKSLTWSHDETEYRLLPCPGSPCLWTVIPLQPGEDPSVKTSKVVIDYPYRPDIAACLGILASLMVRRPQEVKNHLVSLWRYLWTTKDHAMCTLPSPEAARKIQKDECAEANPSSAQDGPLPCPRGGRSRSGILVLLVDQRTNRASLLLWQSRRQTLTALSAPEAEVVALSEALMPAVIIHESCRDIGLEVGLSPQVLFVVKTDNQVTLTQLRSPSPHAHVHLQTSLTMLVTCVMAQACILRQLKPSLSQERAKRPMGSQKCLQVH